VIFGNWPLVKQLSLKKFIIFVGPQKTATTSFAKFTETIGASDKRKEMYLTGLKLIDKQILLGQLEQGMLIWPYLLHRPKRLKYLLSVLDQMSVQYKLVITRRDYDAWIKSLKAHNKRYSRPAFTSKGIITEILMSTSILHKGNYDVCFVDLFQDDLMLSMDAGNEIFKLDEYRLNIGVNRPNYNRIKFYLVDLYLKIKFMMVWKK